MNALNKSSELLHISVNRKTRPVVEREHGKSWNDHVLYILLPFKGLKILASPFKSFRFYFDFLTNVFGKTYQFNCKVTHNAAVSFHKDFSPIVC